MYFNQLFVFLSSLGDISAEIEQSGKASEEHRAMLTRIIVMYREYANLPHAFTEDEKKLSTLQNAEEYLDFIQVLYNNICKTDVKLYVMLCVPSLDMWDMLKPLAKAFMSDSDYVCAAAVPDGLASHMSSDGIDLHSFDKWLESDLCADIVIVPCAYPAEIWNKLLSHALATVYFPLFEEKDPKIFNNVIRSAWRVITSDNPNKKAISNAICVEGANPLQCNPSSIPAPRYRLLSKHINEKKWIAWQISSYEDMFSDNMLSSVDFLTHIIKNTDLNVLWIQPSDTSCNQDALPYLQDIAAAAIESGRVLLLNDSETSFAIQHSCAVCSDNKAIASIFSKSGCPALSARRENGSEKKLRKFIKTVEKSPGRTYLYENLAKNLKTLISREFEKDFLN